uniref:C-type lectin domain-containing protein n=1 Tax=Acrobeloides nanus TaxID=290746 RepID=A0A914C5X5_9BILA
MYKHLAMDEKLLPSQAKSPSTYKTLLILGLIAEIIFAILLLIWTISIIGYQTNDNPANSTDSSQLLQPISAPECHTKWKNDTLAAYLSSTNKYYILIQSIKSKTYINTFTIASEKCEKLGGSLVSIHSTEENEFVQHLVKSNNKEVAFIGLHRDGEKFIWKDGSQVDYTNWHIGEPNDDLGVENCVDIRSKWNDIPCTQINLDAAVCQVECDK